MRETSEVVIIYPDDMAHGLYHSIPFYIPFGSRNQKKVKVYDCMKNHQITTEVGCNPCYNCTKPTFPSYKWDYNPPKCCQWNCNAQIASANTKKKIRLKQNAYIVEEVCSPALLLWRSAWLQHSALLFVQSLKSLWYCLHATGWRL